MFKTLAFVALLVCVFGEADWTVNFNNNGGCGCNNGCNNNDNDAMLMKAKLAWMDWNGMTPAGYSGVSFASPKPARTGDNNEALPATMGSFTANSICNFIGPFDTPFATVANQGCIDLYQNIAWDDRQFQSGADAHNVVCEMRADGNIMCTGEFTIFYKFPRAVNPNAIYNYRAQDTIIIDTHGANWYINYELFAVNGRADNDNSNMAVVCNCPQ
eukprot:TRINITY_DN53837_c0_g1_i1.p1 TRINITY_DN53837_c0_g1~~TRINITY_DN53837_c0_g1_i1.p1  ORF type:complete len:223 (+),score=61.31 TRINITY_DN53837_c0_g1_i1:26-670(+)